MSNVEGSNFGDKSMFVDCPENNIGSSEQFIGNFLETLGDLKHIVKNKIWVTSDTHFRHRRILIYEAAARPFETVEQMNEELVNRWNAKVGPMDVVFHLGDFGFTSNAQTRTILSKMNGRKFLLLGNHDRQQKLTDEKWVSLGFERVFRNPFLLDSKFIFSHEPLETIPDGKVNVYGHVHGSAYFNTMDRNRICVCVERWDCAPVEYEFIKRMFSGKD